MTTATMWRVTISALTVSLLSVHATTRVGCPGPNEYFDSCNSHICPSETCESIGKVHHCPLKPAVCSGPGMCRCNPGHLKDHLGKCIPKNQCPTCKGPNEVFDPCDTPCPLRSCDVDPNLIDCAAPPQLGDPNCVVGCRCADGYARTNNGTCVLREQCPKCTQPNEIYDPCFDNCDPQTCDSIGKKFNCPAKPYEKPNCQGACRCKPDFFRNKNGECTSRENCLKCRGPHEYFACGSACDNECATIKTQGQDNCPIINVKCNDKCYCEKGYARASNGTCIPIKDCPSCPGPNEYFDSCNSNICPPETCESKGKVYNCPIKAAVCSGPGMCRCNSGYLRDRSGKCIPEKQCPCSPCTGPNEYFDSCNSIICPPETCDSKGKVYDCPIQPAVCRGPGVCRCQHGYLRDKTGKCVPEKHCLNKLTS